MNGRFLSLGKPLISRSRTLTHHLTCQATRYTLVHSLGLAVDEYWLISCYSEGGFFKARLTFPPEFPLLPPKMKFITPMWHPNSMHL